MGLANGRILSVSSTGEMAVLLGRQSFFGGIGTLARASLAGGLPREVLESVTEADWGPDGALAVVKRRENQDGARVPGRHQAARGDVDLVDACFADGRPRCVLRVATLRRSAQWERWSLWTDPSRRPRWRKPSMALGLAWSPSGNEVWFSGARSDGPPTIRAVSLSGRERIVERVPAPLKLDDISRDGRVLVTKGIEPRWNHVSGPR